jgi:transposase InsO family protein
MGLILEQTFRFGKGWTGQIIWIRQAPAAAEGREQRAYGQVFLYMSVRKAKSKEKVTNGLIYHSDQGKQFTSPAYFVFKAE